MASIVAREEAVTHGQLTIAAHVTSAFVGLGLVCMGGPDLTSKLAQGVCMEKRAT